MNERGGKERGRERRGGRNGGIQHEATPVVQRTVDVQRRHADILILALAPKQKSLDFLRHSDDAWVHVCCQIDDVSTADRVLICLSCVVRGACLEVRCEPVWKKLCVCPWELQAGLGDPRPATMTMTRNPQPASGMDEYST